MLVLTTLGVYLGLLMVGGAAPQVLAHSATTRNFDISDEIEIKDDLDKNPGQSDDLEKDAEIIRELKLVEAIKSFLKDVKALESINKLDLNKEGTFVHKVWLEEFGETNTSSKNSDIQNPWLETAVEQIIAQSHDWELSSVADWVTKACKGDNCRRSSIKVSLDANEFSLEFAFDKSSAELAKAAAIRFSEILEGRRASLRNTNDLPIYLGTHCIAKDSQVLIVTRLPRAGLDALLAKDAE